MEIMDKLKAVLNIKDPVGVPGRGFCPSGRIGHQYPLLIVKGDKKGQSHGMLRSVILSILPLNLTNPMRFS